MTKNNITLKAIDVQFDMVNDLDKNFAIEGTATLDTYYNYGFTDQAGTFCIKVDTDDTETNSWYLYCDRTLCSDLFNNLKNGSQSIIATCKIARNEYQENQSNMAEVLNVN